MEGAVRGGGEWAGWGRGTGRKIGGWGAVAEDEAGVEARGGQGCGRTRTWEYDCLRRRRGGAESARRAAVRNTPLRKDRPPTDASSRAPPSRCLFRTVTVGVDLYAVLRRYAACNTQGLCCNTATCVYTHVT